MALPSSGTIRFSNINTELGTSSTSTISLNSTAVRTLFNVSSGSIAMSQGFGRERITTVAINSAQGYGQSGEVYTTTGPYNIQGKTTITGTNLQSVQTLEGPLGNEYHNGAEIAYSFDNVNFTRLCTIGGYAFPMNGSSDNRGSTAFTASVSAGISGTNIYIRVGTTTERQALMTVTGTITLQ